ncbi:MAG: N-acetylmuramoyl-L-alanine amidase [Lachnospiraceae bacterium]|nr:N-acetylmuramoyl-L-alanine amidase [Lachnospiraceae bacterium]
MDMNYLVQRRINARKAYRRKVIATIALSAILLVLIVVGLIKIIMDEKKAEDAKQDTNVSENITPGLSGDNSGNTDNNTPGTSGGENQGSIVSATPEPTPTEAPTPTPTPLPAKLVAIDPGHGGEDLGSTRQRLYEKDANLAIALFLKKELEDAGYAVFMIRDTDVTVENKERPAAAIAAEADIYVSIHLNSLEADSDATQGAEVWYADKRDDGSDILAQYVIDELCKVIDTRNRGIKMSNNLIVLKYNEMPACLVECGFITSETERAKLFDPEYQQKVAEGIANGIKKYLALE